MVQWLRPHAANARDPGWIPAQGTRSCMLQLKDPACHGVYRISQIPQLRPTTAK